MKRGRKPKSTEAKALAGNPGKRKPRPDEPKPGVSLPFAPAGLTAAEREIWEARARVDHPAGLLTDSDIDFAKRAVQVTAFADTFHGQIVESDAALEQIAGLALERPFPRLPIVRTTEGFRMLDGAIMQWRAYNVQQFRMFANLERLMLSELGRTPSARSGIGGAKKDKEREKQLARDRAALQPLQRRPGWGIAQGGHGGAVPPQQQQQQGAT